MPTYDYRCGACGHQFEHWQQISEKKLRKCPSCGKPRLERLVGAGAGLIFRGTGFYATDYKRKTGGPATESPAKGGGSDTSSSSGPAKPSSDPKGGGPPAKKKD